MPEESAQDKKGRVRPPRVHITYKVNRDGAMEKKELPFLVGVMGDFTGDPDPAGQQQPLKDRKFTNIDRDNFNDVLSALAPRLAYSVADKLSGDPDKALKVELKFKTMDDFSPERIAEQIPILRELLQTRGKLTELLNQISVKDKLGDLLEEVLRNTDLREALAKELEGEKAKSATGKADED